MTIQGMKTGITSFLSGIIQKFFALSRLKKIAVIVLLAACIPVITIVRSSGRNNGYIVEPAKISTITEIISDSGKILSVGGVDVYSPTKGFITSVFVQNDQTVNENDTLFSVKSSATQQEKQTAYASYMSAVSALKASESLVHTLRSSMFTEWKQFFDLATNDTYEKSDGVPDYEKRSAAEFHTANEDWLAAQQKVIDQETAVAANKAAVSAAWTAYQATQNSTVIAQVAGVVKNLSAAQGNSVGVPTVQTPNILPVLKITQDTKPEAIIAVGQTNITKVKVGHKVILHPDPYTDVTYDGKVVRVDDIGQNIAGVVTYNVYIEILNPNDLLRPEMTLDGDIITNEKVNVLTVPNSAVVLYKDGKAVRVRKGNSMDYIPVKTGIKGESVTEITDGLTEGQEVIVALANEKVKRPGLLGL